MSKYTYNLDLIRTESAELYYLIGVLITDGCIENIRNKKAKRASIWSKDKELVENVRNLISNDIPIKYNKKRNCYHITIHNTKLCEYFISKGCTPNKSLTVSPQNISPKYLRDFLRGCFDGDGSVSSGTYISKKNNKNYKYLKAYICTASEIFANYIHNELNKIQINHGLSCYKQKSSSLNGRKIQSNNKIFRITFGEKSAINFYKYIYYSDNLICLNRKRKIFEI